MADLTLFRIQVVTDGQRQVDSEFTVLDSAVEHVKWLMRHNPQQLVTLDVLPPVITNLEEL